MSIDLRGPAEETPIQAIERLTALKRSFKYAGLGEGYSGGPDGLGCDADDMEDLNTELVYAVMDALPAIREMQCKANKLAHLMEAIDDRGCIGLDINSLCAIRYQLLQGFDNGGLERVALGEFLGSLCDRLTSVRDIAEMKLEVQS